MKSQTIKDTEKKDSPLFLIITFPFPGMKNWKQVWEMNGWCLRNGDQWAGSNDEHSSVHIRSL